MPVHDLDRWEEVEPGVWGRKLVDTERVDLSVEVAVEPAEPVEETVPEGVHATKAAYEYATEQGIDISSVTGTGLDGKVTKPDVEAVVEARGG